MKGPVAEVARGSLSPSFVRGCAERAISRQLSRQSCNLVALECFEP